MLVTARAYDSGDTMAITVVNNCGKYARLLSCCAWVASWFISLVMERERSRSLVIRDIVLYAGPLVGAVDGVGVIFLVWLRVHAATGSFSVVLLLSVLVVWLVKVFSILGNGVVISFTLGDEVISDSV